ncbi:hypothetical protein J2W42_006681 [Rhizobium tibeticum]|jgi:hypothetical protein|uniref:DUF4177 domain-containing protein n=1 Tax=Rhizobium mongolense TaxID=57676 RepID=A0A7W6RW45_9HYPH|nr:MULTISPECIES: hypothetical protein [Rhizobium]MBB4279557.1 hypothetical protein [Rhizobium mongolense]MDP9813805.1 hypothetical protein [Rhizobium tibeticum]
MTWEYLTVEKTLQVAQLNELGASGWELVAVVSPAHFVLHYFFKRQNVPDEDAN